MAATGVLYPTDSPVKSFRACHPLSLLRRRDVYITKGYLAAATAVDVTRPWFMRSYFRHGPTGGDLTALVADRCGGKPVRDSSAPLRGKVSERPGLMVPGEKWQRGPSR